MFLGPFFVKPFSLFSEPALASMRGCRLAYTPYPCKWLRRAYNGHIVSATAALLGEVKQEIGRCQPAGLHFSPSLGICNLPAHWW